MSAGVEEVPVMLDAGAGCVERAKHRAKGKDDADKDWYNIEGKWKELEEKARRRAMNHFEDSLEPMSQRNDVQEAALDERARRENHRPVRFGETEDLSRASEVKEVDLPLSPQEQAQEIVEQDCTDRQEAVERDDSDLLRGHPF